MIIQSYWSLPSQIKIKDNFSRNDGGWLNEKFHAMSWAFSCLKWKEFYGEVNLYTDGIGKKWLIDELELPYNKVEICLDKLNDYNPLLWALPKLYVYSLQNKPFLHVDSDVYIWGKLSKNYLENPLICQNIEHNFPYYKDILNDINTYFNFIPTDLKKIAQDSFSSINAGIIGGNDTKFYKKLFSIALDFIKNNQDNLSKVNVGLLNVVFEQLFFYLLATQDKILINPLFDNVSSQFSELIQFNLCPFQTKYIHTVGFAKKNSTSCNQLEQRLKYEYPKVHDKISKIYQSKKEPSKATATLNNFNENIKISKKLLTDIKNIQTNINVLEKIKHSNFDFSILYTNDIEKILNLKITLYNNCLISKLHHQFPPKYSFKNLESNDNTKIITMLPTNFIFFKNYANEIMFEPLKSWNVLLLYFQNSTLSINELIDKVKPIFISQYNGSDFEFDILNFVMINLVYKNTLQLHQINQ